MKALCTPLSRISLPRAMGTGVVTLLLVLVACEAPTPIVDEEAGAELAVESRSDPIARVEDIIREEIDSSGRARPDEVGPTVYVDGVRIRLDNTLDDLDPASIDRIEVIRGDAARARFGAQAGQGVIQIFTKAGAGGTREAAPVPAPDLPPAPATPGGDLSAAPVFTPYTVAPQLRNTAEVQQALQEEYPALLRNAGVGGQVVVHFFIDEEGVVRQTRVATGSGHEALDSAALRVGQVFDFQPAMNLDVPTAVWIALPITFQAP